MRPGREIGGKMLMWVDSAAEELVFHTDITFVRVDGVGNKIPVS